MKKETWIYSPKLANRFIADCDMPFPVSFNEELFEYYLNMFEPTHRSVSRYYNLLKEVNSDFDGNDEKFLKNFYDTRENVITTMADNAALKEFNNMDMKVFEIVKDKPSVSNKGIYNSTNVGKRFLSIDLRQANFNALRYVNPSILYDTDSYEDFIGKFTDSTYFTNSKHVRQVIFGQLNPKRHITVEKWLINEVRKAYESAEYIKNKGKLVSMITDELIYEIDEDWDEVTNIDNFIREMADKRIPIKTEDFHLCGYEFILKEQQKVINTFYSKAYDTDAVTKLRCVPLQYSCIAYRLLHNQPVMYNDLCFTHDGILSQFKEEFELKPISWNNENNTEKENGESY